MRLFERIFGFPHIERLDTGEAQDVLADTKHVQEGQIQRDQEERDRLRGDLQMLRIQLAITRRVASEGRRE